MNITTKTDEMMKEFDNRYCSNKELDLITPKQASTLKQFIRTEFRKGMEELLGEKITENTSDGYHTFKELYEFRKVYNATLFNEWASKNKYNIHKSKKHFDGEDCFGGGWFIVMATLPTGQISNHYELKDWDLFQCEERERAEEWDGHTAQDVITRLLALNTKISEVRE